MKREKLFFKSDLKDLAKVRDFVSRKAKEANANESNITKIEISCDEWSANIIEHALGNNSDKGFSVECICANNKYQVIYEHEGDKFNPLELGSVDIDEHFVESHERGLGIYIMGKMMDEIHYEYTDNKVNRLTMVKYLNSDS